MKPDPKYTYQREPYSEIVYGADLVACDAEVRLVSPWGAGYTLTTAQVAKIVRIICKGEHVFRSEALSLMWEHFRGLLTSEIEARVRYRARRWKFSPGTRFGVSTITIDWDDSTSWKFSGGHVDVIITVEEPEPENERFF